MLSESCKFILRHHVEKKGRKNVMTELGISSTSLSQVLSDKYGASTDGIEERIMKIYGNNGEVNCPVLGEIDPAQCAANFKRAATKMSAGNPATIRLYLACRKCDFRG